MDYINADEIKKNLKCSDLEAAQLAEKQREEHIEQMNEFCFETLAEPVQVGEQLRAGQSPVPGQHAVGGRAPHRQGAALNVPHRHLEHRLLRAVVDGQGAVDFGDLDIAHDAAAGYVQQGQVLLPFRFGELVGNGLLRQPGVIRAGGQPQLLVILLGQAGHAFRVAGDGLLLSRSARLRKNLL